MPMLLIGCDGGTNATCGVVPEMTRKTVRSDDGGPARRSPQTAVRPGHIVRHDDLLGRLSGRFSRGGRTSADFEMGVGRQPLSSEQQTDLTTLSKTLQCLLAEHGYTNEPVGGCPAGSGANGFDPRQVSEIVQTVVAELRRRGLT